jgi:hypothetical protein
MPSCLFGIGPSSAFIARAQTERIAENLGQKNAPRSRIVSLSRREIALGIEGLALRISSRPVPYQPIPPLFSRDGFEQLPQTLREGSAQ